MDPPPKGWYKRNINTSRLEFIKSTTISYVYRKSKEKVLKHSDHSTGGCTIIIVKTSVIREAIRAAIIMNIPTIVVERDSLTAKTL